MRGEPPGRVENYTAMCLWMGFVNLLWIMGAIWAFYGLVPVIVLALILNRLISHLGTRIHPNRQGYAPRRPSSQ